MALRKKYIGSTPTIAEERRFILSQKSSFFIREAYKTLRSNTMFALADQDGCKVVLLTSSVQGEGKSITSLNLAISFAEAENRVILIDCDLRRPKLARLLEKSSPVGLSNLLLDPSGLEAAIIPTGIERLDIILSGDIPPNPSELLGSARMMALIEKLRERYDYIILDTPPVNLVTDAAVLAPRSSGVLLIVRAGKSERGQVMQAMEQLRYAQARLLGFVLDDISTSGGRYGYGKYKHEKYSRCGRYSDYDHYDCYGGYSYGYSKKKDTGDASK